MNEDWTPASDLEELIARSGFGRRALCFSGVLSSWLGGAREREHALEAASTANSAHEHCSTRASSKSSAAPLDQFCLCLSRRKGGQTFLLLHFSLPVPLCFCASLGSCESSRHHHHQKPWALSSPSPSTPWSTRPRRSGRPVRKEKEDEFAFFLRPNELCSPLSLSFSASLS